VSTIAADRAEEPQGPSDIAPSGWWGIAKQTWAEGGDDNLTLIASGIAFNAFLALVPLLTAVVLSYGLIASPSQVEQHIAQLAQALPREAAQLIGDQLANIVKGTGSAHGFGLLLALAIALYGALRGASGIITGLNIVYDIEEDRSFLRQTALALAITVGLIAVFMLASAAISLLAMVESLLPRVGGAVHMALQVGSWIAAAAGVSGVIALIYAYAPNREHVQWKWLTPGSLIATAVWIIATLAFSFYVSNFGSYNATYGALGAVIVFLTWLYLSAYILLLGGELNQVLARSAGDDESIGEGKSDTPAAAEG
jgi:membrane protein